MISIYYYKSLESWEIAEEGIDDFDTSSDHTILSIGDYKSIEINDLIPITDVIADFYGVIFHSGWFSIRIKGRKMSGYGFHDLINSIEG